MNYGILLFLFINSLNCFSQERNWTASTSKDGLVEVKYEITSSSDSITRTIVYYEAKTSSNGSINDLRKYMTLSTNYQQFLEYTDESKEIEKYSANEWLMYLYFDQPWPLPNSDCVHRMDVKDTLSNGFIISATTNSTAYPLGNVQRMEIYDVKYVFIESGDQIELTIKAKFSPIGSLPKWLLATWFPEGPAGIVRRIMMTE